MRQELADKITADLDRYGWRQFDGPVSFGSWSDVMTGDAPGCLSLSAQRAFGWCTCTRPGWLNPEHVAAFEDMRAAILKLYPERVRQHDNVIPGFNDHPLTTEEDVRLVIKHAVTEGDLCA